MGKLTVVGRLTIGAMPSLTMGCLLLMIWVRRMGGWDLISRYTLSWSLTCLLTLLKVTFALSRFLCLSALMHFRGTTGSQCTAQPVQCLGPFIFVSCWLSGSHGAHCRVRRQRQTETDRDRQRQTETDRDRPFENRMGGVWLPSRGSGVLPKATLSPAVWPSACAMACCVLWHAGQHAELKMLAACAIAMLRW